jgi:hypothetical protein
MDYHLMQLASCQHLKDFMTAQLEVVGRHLDEHKYLRKMGDKDEALASFINDYGWLIREMYCTKICGKREDCEIASQMSSSGDLLRNHNKGLV